MQIPAPSVVCADPDFNPSLSKLGRYCAVTNALDRIIELCREREAPICVLVADVGILYCILRIGLKFSNSILICD